MRIYKRDSDKATLIELKQDAGELIYLIKDGLSKLNQAQSKWRVIRKSLSPLTFNYVNDRLVTLINLLERILLDTKFFNDEISEPLPIRDLVERKYALNDLIRVVMSEIAGLITSADWQSPSFIHTLYSQAGFKTGRIKANLTDYTRDQHIDGNNLQKKFAQEYLGISSLSMPRLLFTQSGMAALTTILVFLLREKLVDRPIILGKYSYFQNKELIKQILPQKVIEVEETDLEALKQAVINYQPSVVMVDALCNAPTLKAPDLDKWRQILNKYTKKKTYWVIDNTCLSLLNIPPKSTRRVRCISWESLNKFYQFGLDRTTGGYILADAAETIKLFYARMHAGTNITPVSLAMIPTPNKALLIKRLERLKRNASIMTMALKSNPVKAVYSGGNLVTVAFEERKQKPGYYRHLIKNIITKAKNQNVNIVGGSSFGLNTTRVFLTSLVSIYSPPFFRIALGTETSWEMERLTKIIVDSLK